MLKPDHDDKSDAVKPIEATIILYGFKKATSRAHNITKRKKKTRSTITSTVNEWEKKENWFGTQQVHTVTTSEK